MSKLRINTSDWIDLLARQADMSKKDAGDFIKALLTVIEEALLSKDSVRIKGLGTFKLQWNAPRKSVDVNTGEDIIIDGYYRVAFTPDAELRDLANEPYAHLEAVVIDEAEDGQKVKKEADDSDEIPLKHFDEQVTEIKDILSEINALNHTNDVQQDSGKEDAGKSDAEKSEPEKQEVIDQDTGESDATEQIADKPADEKPKGKEKNSKPEDRKKQTVRAESAVRERKSSESKDDVTKKKVSVSGSFEERSKKTPTSKSRKLDLLFVAVLAGGLLVYLAIDHKVFTTISQYIESYRIQKALAPDFEEPITPLENQDFDALQFDFEPAEFESSMEDKSDGVSQSRPDDLEQLFNQTRSYHDFIATEEVIPGSRLTRIAERHYGVKEFWVYIYEANREILESPAEIVPGMLLKIPRLNPVLADKDNPRCIEYALKLQEEYLKE